MQNVIPRLFLFALLLPALALAKPSDTRALNQMESGRILWDITLSNPEGLIARLAVIEETYQDMLRQGVTPNMVFAFRGGAAGLMAKDPNHLTLEQQQSVRLLQQRIAKLQQLKGVHMEVCQIAARRFDLKQQDLIPGLHMVGNTFLSIMGYQNQGYATIRID
jgi:intracellular sulfur oxidation DsrE/DsrF family protein